MEDDLERIRMFLHTRQRPCGLDELSDELGLDPRNVRRRLSELVIAGGIEEICDDVFICIYGEHAPPIPGSWMARTAAS